VTSSAKRLAIVELLNLHTQEILKRAKECRGEPLLVTFTGNTLDHIDPLAHALFGCLLTASASEELQIYDVLHLLAHLVEETARSIPGDEFQRTTIVAYMAFGDETTESVEVDFGVMSYCAPRNEHLYN
jgi:hypothetical protein